MGASQFCALCHLPSRWNIYATVVPNWTRLEPLESINLDLSEDLKNEETIVPKDFQATAQKTQEKWAGAWA